MPQGLRRALVTAVVGVVVTLGSAPRVAGQETRLLRGLIDSLRPYVEGATRLTFDTMPAVAVASRAEVRAYLEAQVSRAEVSRRMGAELVAYQLLGFLDDTTGYRRLMLGFMGDQVLGYYDPPTRRMVAVAGASPSALREVLGHELVHALQDRYVRLDSIRFADWDSDRLSAAQAVVEGQATLTTLRLAAPGYQLLARDKLWSWLVARMKQNAAATGAAAASAPLFLTEGALFPYIKGAEFLYWWNASPFGDTLPYGPRMPVSTEQILHPDRYAAGDRPIGLRFADSIAGVLTENVVGEYAIQVLTAQLGGARRLGALPPIGWGGDRYRVYETPNGGALVWVTVWDDVTAAERFRDTTGRLLLARRRAGYRADLARVEVGGRPGMRFTFAPSGWPGWSAPPAVALADAPGR